MHVEIQVEGFHQKSNIINSTNFFFKFQRTYQELFKTRQNFSEPSGTQISGILGILKWMDEWMERWERVRVVQRCWRKELNTQSSFVDGRMGGWEDGRKRRRRGI